MVYVSVKQQILRGCEGKCIVNEKGSVEFSVKYINIFVFKISTQHFCEIRTITK